MENRNNKIGLIIQSYVCYMSIRHIPRCLGFNPTGCIQFYFVNFEKYLNFSILVLSLMTLMGLSCQNHLQIANMSNCQKKRKFNKTIKNLKRQPALFLNFIENISKISVKVEKCQKKRHSQ